YIAMLSIPLFIAVLIFFWIRKKFKSMFKESVKLQKDLINQPKPPLQYKVDAKEEKRKFIPWREMTAEQRNEWKQKKGLDTNSKFTESDRLAYRSKKHEERTGFKIVEAKQIKK